MRQSQGKQEINVEDFPNKCIKKAKKEKRKIKRLKKKLDKQFWKTNS